MIKVDCATQFHDGTRLRLQCLMSDKSMWLCDLDGTNWKLVTPSIEKLTEKFNTK